MFAKNPNASYSVADRIVTSLKKHQGSTGSQLTRLTNPDDHFLNMNVHDLMNLYAFDKIQTYDKNNKKLTYRKDDIDYAKAKWYVGNKKGNNT